MASILCGNCHNHHSSVREVWACHTFGDPNPAPTQPKSWRDEPITVRQRDEIKRLGGLVTAGMTKGQASDKIETLRKFPKNQRPVAASASHLAASSPPLSTPLSMIETLRDGRYAVRPDANTQYMFIKVWRPKSGRKRGCLIISTQHSESYKECIVRWPSGKWSVYDRRPDTNLLFIVADPVTSARNYAREKNVCCSCGKELTDGRSIWYGIGPECEKRWPEIINAVDSECGRYWPGKTHAEDCDHH